MSKWNQVISPSKPDTVNRAGGEAFTETPEVALVNLVLTSFMKDKFYEAAKDLERISIQSLSVHKRRMTESSF
jgi:hypothetical protein